MYYKTYSEKPALPAFLEGWIKNKIGNHVAIAKEVKRLSEVFTKDRGSALVNGEYMNSTELRMAYLAFFLPKNILKTCCVMREVPIDNKKCLRIADIGSGPGTASLGVMSFFSEYGSEYGIEEIKIDLLEANRENNDFAIESLEALYSEIQKRNMNFKAVFNTKTCTVKNRNIPLEGTYDILLFSNSINEMDIGVNVLEDIVDRHLADTGSLVIIEPALNLTSRSLLNLRNELIARKTMFPWAPCPHILPCPALISCKDWCHEEKDWQSPPFVDTISHIIGNKKNTLKYSFMVFRKQKPPICQPDGLLARAISFPIKEKGRVLVHLCCEGRKLRATLAKSKITAINKLFTGVSHGDMLLFDNVKTTEETMIIGRESIVKMR